MPVIDALGSIASEFSKGFLQGRLLNAQKAIQAHTQNLEDVRALSEAADRFKDNPALQEQYLSQLHDALDKLPKPPKSAQQGGQAGGGGIKDFFANMFSRKQAGPQAPAGTNPANPTPEADNASAGGNAAALPPVTPGSHTFGAPAAMMTPPVPTAPAAVPTVNPAQFDTALNPQEEQQFQGWKAQYAPNDSGQDYDLRGAFKAGLTPDPQTGHWPDTFKKPNHPTFSNQSQYATGPYAAMAGQWTGPNQDQFVPAAGAATSQKTATPVSGTGPAPGQANGGGDFMPNPSVIRGLAKDNWWRLPEFRFTQKPQYVAGNPRTELAYAQKFADDHTDAALYAVDQHLKEHPEIRTLKQAHEVLGPEFDHVMDAVNQYENEGFLAKGRLEGWQKTRFDDVRFGSEKYDSRRTVHGADGNEYQHNPVTDKFDIMVGGPSYESKIDNAFQTVATARANGAPTDEAGKKALADANITIQAHQDKLAGTEKGKRSADDEVRSDYLDELKAGVKNGPAEQRILKYMPKAHPPQPAGYIQAPPTVGPMGQRRFTMINPKDPSKVITTDLVLPTNFDLDKVMRNVPRGTSIADPNAPGGKRLAMADMKVFDPVQVKQAYRSGELGGIDALRSIATSGHFVSDAEKTEVQRFLKEAENPSPYENK